VVIGTLSTSSHSENQGKTYPLGATVEHSIAFNAELASEGLNIRHIQRLLGAPRIRLPQVNCAESGAWRRWIDTSLESPQEIVEWRRASPVSGYTYKVGPRVVVVLWASLAQVTGL
jgi:isoamylase